MGQFSQLLITPNTPLVKLGFQNPNSPQISALRNLQIPSYSAMKIRTSIRFLVSNGSCEMLVPSNPRFRHVFRAGNSGMISHLELEKTGKTPDKQVNGIFWILLLNLGLYVADHWFQIPDVKSLYLYHAWPRWYQFITAAFCHANWNHLSSNLFFLYIFGKLVEEEEGSFALWISYLLTGAGANLVSWMVLPRTAVSVGASGAVFGLFAISVLVKIRWDWRKILEVLILGQFVIKKVMEAAQASAGMSGGGFALQSVNHIAHLSGALIGVSLVWLISRIPSQSSKQDAQSSGRITDKRKLY